MYMGLNLDSGELMAIKQLDTKDVSARELAQLENELKVFATTRHRRCSRTRNSTAAPGDAHTVVTIGTTGTDISNARFAASKISEHNEDSATSMGKGGRRTARFDHPNIVKYLGMERPSANMLCIFLEYVPGGSIRSLIDKFGALTATLVRVYTKQLLLGLEYLHRHGIAHRDIKGANLLVTNDGVIKLADFGASKRAAGTMTQSLSSSSSRDSEDEIPAAPSGLKGTPLWMAPEVIKEAKLDDIGWRKADVWSVGCTVVEMATGQPPWKNLAHSNPLSAMYHIAMDKNGSPPYGDALDEHGVAFLDSCFSRDPSARLSCTALLAQAFLTQLPATRQPQRSVVTGANTDAVTDTTPVILKDDGKDMAEDVGLATAASTAAFHGFGHLGHVLPKHPAVRRGGIRKLGRVRGAAGCGRCAMAQPLATTMSLGGTPGSPLIPLHPVSSKNAFILGSCSPLRTNRWQHSFHPGTAGFEVDAATAAPITTPTTSALIPKPIAMRTPSPRNARSPFVRKMPWQTQAARKRNEAAVATATAPRAASELDDAAGRESPLRSRLGGHWGSTAAAHMGIRRRNSSEELADADRKRQKMLRRGMDFSTPRKSGIAQQLEALSWSPSLAKTFGPGSNRLDAGERVPSH